MLDLFTQICVVAFFMSLMLTRVNEKKGKTNDIYFKHFPCSQNPFHMDILICATYCSDKYHFEKVSDLKGGGGGTKKTLTPLDPRELV